MLSRVGDVRPRRHPPDGARAARAARDRQAPVRQAAGAAQQRPGGPPPREPHPRPPGRCPGDDGPACRGRAELPGRHRPRCRPWSSRLPATIDPLRARARAYHGLGVLLRRLNRFREAESWLREAVRLREQLAARSPERSRPWPGPCRTAATTSVPCWPGWSAPLPRTRQLYDRAIKDQEAAAGPRPRDPENRLKLARYRNNLAILESRRDPGERPSASIARSWTSWRGWIPPRASSARAQVASGTRLEQPCDSPLGKGTRGRGREDPHAGSRRARTADRRVPSNPPVSARAGVDLQQSRPAGPAYQAGRARRLGRSARPPSCSEVLPRRNPQVPDYQEDRAIALFQLEPVSRPRPTWPPANASLPAPGGSGEADRRLPCGSRLSQRPGA